MFFHDAITADPLYTALLLATDAGQDVCLHCLEASTDQAGTLALPLREAGDLSFLQAAACDAVLRQGTWCRYYRDHLTCDGATSARRLRMVARLASFVLPTVIVDHQHRFRLRALSDGFLPQVDDIEFLVSALLDRLRAYLAEHDHGEWVDPNVLAGAVADVHDAARMLEVLHELTALPAPAG